MNRVFVDANIILRFLTNDIPEQANKFRELLLSRRKGELELFTNEIVFAEIVWTLKSFYGMGSREIKEIVSPIVASDDLQIAHRAMLLNALQDFVEHNVDFNDAYIHAWMEEHDINIIATFNDRHFKRFRDIRLLS